MLRNSGRFRESLACCESVLKRQHIPAAHERFHVPLKTRKYDVQLCTDTIRVSRTCHNTPARSEPDLRLRPSKGCARRTRWRMLVPLVTPKKMYTSVSPVFSRSAWIAACPASPAKAARISPGLNLRRTDWLALPFVK